MGLKLLAGLGNPEPRYDMTRHNAGFAVAAELVTKYGGSFTRKPDLFCELAKLSVSPSASLLVVRPLTYMNLSGRAVRAVLRFFKIDQPELLVVHDDVSLPLGKLRYQSGGGAGGQHGVESIIEHLGDPGFDRLKLGIGPDPGGATRAEYVLAKFPEHQRDLYRRVLATAVESIDIWIAEGIQVAANRYNGIDHRSAPVADGRQ